MKTLTLPDGTERHVLEDGDLPDEIPQMTLPEIQAAYMGMLTALVTILGPEAAVQTQAFASQYLDQMINGVAIDAEIVEDDYAMGGEFDTDGTPLDVDLVRGDA